MLKFVKMYSLTVAAMAIPLLIERGVIQPLVARTSQSAPAVFGTWVWFLGAMMFVAMTVGYGAGLPLMRNLADLNAKNRRQWLTYARWWSYGITFPLLVTVSLVLFFYKRSELGIDTAIWGGLAAFAAALTQIEYMSTSSVMRVAQRFGDLLTVRIIYVLPVVAGGLWLHSYGASSVMKVISAAYACSFLFVFIAGRAMIRRFSWSIVMDIPSVKDSSVSFRMYFWVGAGSVLVSLADQAVVYVPRVMAGLLLEMRDVGVLVAATTGAALCVLPISMIGSTFLSLLSRKKEVGWDHRQWRVFVVSVGSIGLAIGATVWYTRFLVLDLLYPTFKGAALAIYFWVAIAASASTMVALIRPVALRFLSIHSVSSYSVFSVFVMTVLIYLFSFRGIEGVVIGYAAGAWGQLIIWSGFLWRAKDEFAQIEGSEVDVSKRLT
ncbi:MAG: hypothetical protein GY822_13710 [Deltaproteobacteria bacterium]|nr:hypothetical protein [Deltaproteobacteria bacterium]